MARAAMGMSLRDLSKDVGISHTAIARVETNHPKATVRTAEILEKHFERERIFFGPSNGVSINANAFNESRWLVLAALQIAVNHGCGTKEMLDAKAQAETEIDACDHRGQSDE